MPGWIKLHKSLVNWEWRDQPNTLAVFINLLLEANFCESTWRGVKLNPGDLIFGRKEFSKRTGISERSIRTALTNLKSTNNLTIKSTNRYSVISINNWVRYQIQDQQTDQQATSKRPASDHTIRIKELKNKRNTNVDLAAYLSLFNSLFGSKYTETSARGGKLRLRLKTYSLEQILQATRHLASSPFHQGKNDRGWKADPDFLIRSDEQIDKWLNTAPAEVVKPRGESYIPLAIREGLV